MGETPVGDWKVRLKDALTFMLETPVFAKNISKGHIQDTPDRVVKSYLEYFSGLWDDPKLVLEKGFETGHYDEMVFISNINFVSFCAHHLVPFIGKCHFAYLPSKRIVGLSKVPRFVDILARRPQVQEKLTAEIADIFMEVVQPKGCGVMMEAEHFCMRIRGVMKEGAVTRTTKLCGVFKEESVKNEFLMGVKG